jgi:hypothetical protein
MLLPSKAAGHGEIPKPAGGLFIESRLQRQRGL